MKKFFSSLLGSFVGTWIAFLLFGIVIFISGMIMIASLSVSSFKTPKISISNNSVLYLDLSGTITERPYNKTLQEYINNSNSSDNNLYDILKAINNAAENNNVSGIVVHCGSASSGFATATEIRDALLKFKKESGKWIYAYGESIDQYDYYIASVADSIFMNPVGMLDIHGLASGIPFFKGTLDKLGVEMQVIRVGTYKSAVEPYMLTSMSDANRLQTQTYLNNLWKNICDGVSSSRKISVATINEFADSLRTFDSAQTTVDNKFIDGLCYDHEFDSKIKNELGIADDEDINYVNVTNMANSNPGKEGKTSNSIAVLYATGEISVSGNENAIYSEELVPIILDIAKDDDIKGLVLRVNSPGGSAYASEQIWEALEQFKKAGKPFAVSMGDYAASGGYYISCGAQQIFAEPTTITGSIGIFAVIPSFQGLMTDKLGITMDFVTTNKNSDISVVKPLSPAQRAAFQNYVNQGYELFTSRCATGRKMDIDKLKSIAEGRVWDATEAKKIGLVDQFGNIDDAVEWVAQKAGISESYSIQTLPEYKEDFMNMLFISMTDGYAEAKMKEQFGMLYSTFKDINHLLQQDKLQCRMEYITIQ